MVFENAGSYSCAARLHWLQIRLGLHL